MTMGKKTSPFSHKELKGAEVQTSTSPTGLSGVGLSTVMLGPYQQACRPRGCAHLQEVEMFTPSHQETKVWAWNCRHLPLVGGHASGGSGPPRVPQHWGPALGSQGDILIARGAQAGTPSAASWLPSHLWDWVPTHPALCWHLSHTIWEPCEGGKHVFLPFCGSIIYRKIVQCFTQVKHKKLQSWPQKDNHTHLDFRPHTLQLDSICYLVVFFSTQSETLAKSPLTLWVPPSESRAAPCSGPTESQEEVHLSQKWHSTLLEVSKS